MNEAMIEMLVQILGEVILSVLGIAGTWLLAKMAERNKLANIQAATWELTDAARQTVMELQQTIVEKWKAAHDDGKLTEEEVKQLGVMLLEKTMEKLSEPAKNVLIAAGKDITAIIQGEAEALIASMKKAA